MLEIELNGLKDSVARDNFYTIVETFRMEPMLNFGWKFYQVVFSAAVTDYAFRHGLGYRPKDWLITDVSDNAAAYFNMDTSTSTYATFTCSGACTVRFLLGNLDVNSQA